MAFNLAEAIDDLEPPYTRAARKVVGQAFCANWQTISGFWRGRFGVAGAWPAYIQAFRDCGADFGEGVSGEENARLTFRPGPAFEGGQCPTQYKIDGFCSQRNGGAPTAWNAFPTGPVSGFSIEPSPNNPDQDQLVVYAASSPSGAVVQSSPTLRPSGGWTGYTVTSVLRLDGLPDDCGSLPPDNPEFPPEVPTPDPPPGDPDGDPILVPGIGDINVNITFEGDVYDFDFNVGDITVRDNGNLAIDIDNRSWVLTPELDLLSPGDLLEDLADDLIPDINAQVAILQAQVEALRIQLQCVIANICSFEQLAYSIPTCGGGEALLAPNGVGVDRVIDVVIETLEVVNQNVLAICDPAESEVPDVARVLLLQEEVDVTNEAGTPVSIGEDVEYIDVEFLKIADGNKVYKTGNDGEEQGRFGYLFQASQNGFDRLWGEPIPLWFRKNRIKVRREEPKTVFVRVSSHFGNEYRIYDSGVRTE